MTTNKPRRARKGKPRPHRATEMSTGEWKCTCGAKLRNEGQVTAHMIAAQDATAPNTGKPSRDGQNQAAETRAAQPHAESPTWYVQQGIVYLQEVARWIRAQGQSDMALTVDNYADHLRQCRAAQPGNAPKLTVDDLHNFYHCGATNCGECNAKLAELNALLASRSTPAAPAPASTEAPVDAPYCLRCRADNCDHGNCSDWTCALSCEICNKDMPKVESNRLPRVVYAIPSGEGNFLVWIGSDRQEAERMADASRTIIEYHRPPSTEAPGAPDEIVRKLLGDSKLLARGEFNADGTFAAPAATPSRHADQRCKADRDRVREAIWPWREQIGAQFAEVEASLMEAIQDAREAETHTLPAVRPGGEGTLSRPICKWCVEDATQPEWSTHAKVWIHRRERLDKQCLNPPTALAERLRESTWWRHLTFHHQESYFAIEGDKRIASLRAALAELERPRDLPSV